MSEVTIKRARGDYRLGGLTPQGFAALAKEERSRIAGIGGRRANELGRAHKWTPEEAQAAGRIGGKAKHPNKGYGSHRKRQNQP